MQMRPIGYLRSIFQFKNGTPRQPSLCSIARGSLTVEKSVFNNPDHALEGLEQFSHAWCVMVLIINCDNLCMSECMYENLNMAHNNFHTE